MAPVLVFAGPVELGMKMDFFRQFRSEHAQI